MEMQADYLIVGGGSAGCVLANRLSADGRSRVVLLEAGRDQPPDAVDPEIADSYARAAYFQPRNTWSDLRVYTQALRVNHQSSPPLKRYEQARIMGGGSSINDMQANRGLPDDYDDWERSGATGWGWKDVLPYFRKLERDADFSGPLHGDRGPIPIRRIMPDVWPGFSKAAAAAFQALGYAALDDQNAEFGDGYFPIAISNMYDRRVSTATAYLDNAARSRPNLRIVPNAFVHHLLLNGEAISGCLAIVAEESLTVRASETILAAGALHSPALLMRVGVGPGDMLRRAGISTQVNRPGIGRNLQEHPAISISAWMHPDHRLRPNLRRHIHVGLRYSSNLAGVPGSDMYMLGLSRTAWHPVGGQIGSLMTFVNKSYSRGRTTVVSPDPMAEPTVELALLSDARDRIRLRQGFRVAARAFATQALASATRNPFPTSYSERIRDLGVVSLKNVALTHVLARMLDGPEWLRSGLIRYVVNEGAGLARMLSDEDVLDDFLVTMSHGCWHPCGTCRMGNGDDPDDVVDSRGRVFGLQGVRVVDASIMPVIPRANTNIPTIMIAEKMSDHILEDRG